MIEFKLVWFDALDGLNVDYADDGGYQRKRTDLEIRRAAAKCSWLPPILVSKREDGRYFVVDGGLRLSVAKELKRGLWAVIFDGTRDFERECFIAWNSGRPVSLSEKLKASAAPLAKLVRSLAYALKGHIWFLRDGSPHKVGTVNAGLAARICYIGATGENVSPSQLMLLADNADVLRAPGANRAATAAMTNVLEVFTNQPVYYEKAVAVAEATFANNGRRFTDSEVKRLRSLPWTSALTPGVARSNWNLGKLRAMTFRALGLRLFQMERKARRARKAA